MIAPSAKIAPHIVFAISYTQRIRNLKDFLKYKCELYLKQSQCKIIAAYHTSNHRLAIETRQWSTIPTSRDIRGS